MTVLKQVSTNIANEFIHHLEEVIFVKNNLLRSITIQNIHNL